METVINPLKTHTNPECRKRPMETGLDMDEKPTISEVANLIDQKLVSKQVTAQMPVDVARAFADLLSAVAANYDVPFDIRGVFTSLWLQVYEGMRWTLQQDLAKPKVRKKKPAIRRGLTLAEWRIKELRQALAYADKQKY